MIQPHLLTVQSSTVQLICTPELRYVSQVISIIILAVFLTRNHSSYSLHLHIHTLHIPLLQGFNPKWHQFQSSKQRWISLLREPDSRSKQYAKPPLSSSWGSFHAMEIRCLRFLFSSSSNSSELIFYNLQWYTIVGTFPSPTGIRPLVCLHGGPGVPHDNLRAIQKLWTTHQVPVIMYDQLGCGRSTHLPEKRGDEGFWTVDLFLKELDNLLTHLGIQNDYDLYGHSWGGNLASEHAVRQPKGLNKLIIANAPSSSRCFSFRLLKSDFPVHSLYNTI
jgi:alpha/beta hydrolase fold